MATSINTFNVNLVMNANEYIKSSDLSRGATGRLRRSLEEARTPAERLQRQLALLAAGLREGAIPDQRVYNRLVQQANQEYINATKSVNAWGHSFIKLARDMHVAILFVRQIAQFFTRPIVMFADLEKTQATMEALLGSAEKATFMIKDLRKFAAETPLTFEGAAQGAKQLLQFGVSAHKVLPQVKMLGEIVGGDTQQFKQLTLAMSQMQAANRLLGQDLRQMTDAGFNPLHVAAKALNLEFDVLLDKQRKGLISADWVMDIVKMATSPGGMHFGKFEKIAETTAGALERAKSQVDILNMQIGEAMKPLTTDLLEMWLDMGPAIKGTVAAAKQLIESYEKMKAPLDPLLEKLNVIRMTLFKMGGYMEGMIKSAINWMRLSFWKQDQEAVNKMLEDLIEMRELIGDGYFTQKQLRMMDDYIEKQEKSIFLLEEQADAERRAKQEADRKVRESTELEDANLKSFEKAQMKLQMELNLRKQGVVEGTYMNELLNGRTEIQARILADLEKEIDLAKEKAKAEETRWDRLEAQVKKNNKLQEDFEKRVMSLREKAHAQALRSLEDEKKARKKFFDDVKALGLPSADKGSGADVEALQKMRQAQMIDKSTPSVSDPTQKEVIDATLEQLKELREANIQRTAVLDAINNMAEKIGGIKIGKTR